MRTLLLTSLVLIAYALHQDIWFWNRARPLLFGVLPIGLAYHVFYSVAAAALMWLLVRQAWPALSDVEGPALSNVEGPSHLENDR
jgi:hypothetical protein